jgi:hypothetical protein
MSSPISPASPRPDLAPSRRELVAAGATGLALAGLPASGWAQASPSMAELIARVTEVPRRSGGPSYSTFRGWSRTAIRSMSRSGSRAR